MASLCSVNNVMAEREQLEQAIIIQESLRATLGDAMVDATIAALRQKLDALESAPPIEQRKQATVLFGDISGYTAMSELMDAEEVKEMMNELWARLDKAIRDYGGTVVAHMGDGVMAVWGAQTAQEDDPERAIRAALKMQEEVTGFAATSLCIIPMMGAQAKEKAPVLRMRVGINTGPVILGTVATTKEFTALGDTTNLAARLESAAPIGGILIAHDTYRQVRGAFDVLPLKPISVKGKSEPIKVYVVERAKPRAFRIGTRGVEGVETRMIGRHSELECLLEALQTVTDDHVLQMVTVLGEAGLGKTRLLYEFDSRIEVMPERVLVFNARATESRRGLSYSLVRDLFSFRFEILDSDPVAVAREKLEQGMVACFGSDEEAQMRTHFIGHLIGLDFSASPYLSGILNEPKQIRDRAFHYATQFFAEVARERTVVLYLDDLHWADDGSLEFIEHMAHTCTNVQLLLLCLSRPTLLEQRPSWGLGRTGCERLRLLPLSKRESRQLVEEILRQAEDVPQELRDLVVSGAEGNPFYLEELIKMLIDQKVIEPGEERWSVDVSRLAQVRVPPTLTGVLQARLDGLMVWEKIVLQRASIVGREFWDSAVEHLKADAIGIRTEPDERQAPAVLETLRHKELIFWRATSAFAGTNEYIFKHTLLRDVTYESVLMRERRKYHKMIAEWLVERSGERVNQYASTIAEHYEKANEIERAVEWYGRAGQQAREAYALPTAIGFYRKALEFSFAAGAALEKASWGQQRLQWYDGLAEALWWQARFAEAVEAYTAMREAAEREGNMIAQARACNGLALVQERQGDNRASMESAKCAEELAGGADPTPEALTEMAAALNRQCSVLYRLGEVASGMATGERALVISTALGQRGRRERAGGLRALGVGTLMQGQYEQSYSYLEQAQALYRELGDRRGVSNMLITMGETARQRGDYLAAVSLYQEALTIARDIGERTGQIYCLHNLAGVYVGLGNYADAEADLRQVISMTGPSGYQVLTETYIFLAAACLGQGKVDEALEAAQRALSLGQKTENQELIAGAWRALGLVAARLPEPITIENKSFDAAACFGESLSLFTESGMEAERARTLSDWARYEQERGMNDEASAKIEEAREIFTRLGMERELERMNEGMKGKG
jgi:class 3 adenylate cyclase/tetratricopeptide (TPR) repeat protein